MNKLRWKICLLLSRLSWWVMPEPQRSSALKDFDDAFLKIQLRETGKAQRAYRVEVKDTA